MLFEVTPNWHPAIVHFPIALTLSAILALWLGAVLPDSHFNRQLQTVGHWNLRAGFISAVIAAWFGILAFINVPHDEIAYKAKTLHRDWAIITVAAFIPFFILSCLRHRLTPHIAKAFTAGLIIPALLILRTGWLGGEVVYRYGVGVQRLPQVESNAPRGDQPRTEGPVSKTGNMRYPDPELKGDANNNTVTGDGEPRQ